ncbi:MAG: proton-conducting membrane transporter [Clostridia bacterium]|nr:proton-conducting membrane transporter [Clostridia bacterium]
MQLLMCALLPVLLGALLRLIHKLPRGARMCFALLSALLTSVCVGYLSFTDGGERYELFRLSEQFVFALRLDGAGMVYIGLAAALWPISVLYAIEYMRHEKREGNFFSWYLAAYGASVLLSASDNLFTLYISYELLTLFTVPLVWHIQDDASTKAAFRYMLYLIGGAALGFMAMLGLSDFGLGAFGRNPVLPEGADMGWFRVLCLLGFLGFGVKTAVLPLSRWLPVASVAPTPVTALLHAVAVVNAGVLAVARFLYYTVPLDALRGTWVQTAMLILCAATVLFASAMAVREQHLKRRLAWSTVSNLSYMLLGLSLMTEHGMAAGLSHMVFHGLMKIILFFCAGAVLTQTGFTLARQTHGLGRQMRVTFCAFTVAGLSLMGVPPLPGFVSKYALATAAFTLNNTWAFIGGIALLVSSVLTCIYIFTVVFPAYFLQPARTGADQPHDPGPCMKISLILLCLLLIAAGMCAGRIMEWLTVLAEGGIV